MSTTPVSSDSEDENIAEMGVDEPAPQYPFDFKRDICIPDTLRFICGLPKDSEIDGVDTFRAILMAKGKTAHVPAEPSSYVTTAPWRTQLSLSLVHFVKETQRKMELLLSFTTFDKMSATATGVSCSRCSCR